LTDCQVPLNPAFTVSQVISALSHLTASHLIISTETNLPRKPPRSNVNLLTQLVPEIQGTGKVESESVPSLKSIVLVDNSAERVDTASLKATVPYETVQEDGGSQAGSVPGEDTLDYNEIVNIQFTSGTTSMPKAACLTHRNILNNGKSIGDRMLLTPEDIICCPPPLFQ
jgi:long-subunit acyl-CoA synthetase (AMP-forming)